MVEGVIPHLVDGGLSILQYTDDTIIFMEHDLEKARNLKLILSAFKQLSGLKINFHKCCFVLVGHKTRSMLRQLVWGWAGPISYEVFGHSDSLLETHTYRMETCR
jgi:hypothetical protein